MNKGIVTLAALLLTVGLLKQQPVQAGSVPLLQLTPVTLATPQITRLEIDLSRRRLTAYWGTEPVKTYSIAVGRQGWQTPIGSFQVMQMTHNPTWMNPLTRSITPSGDPQNPLGSYWIGFWTDGRNWVGMHGTPNPESVGQAASHGCVRLYNQDIQELFSQVTVGTPVIVVP